MDSLGQILVISFVFANRKALKFRPAFNELRTPPILRWKKRSSHNFHLKIDIIIVANGEVGVLSDSDRRGQADFHSPQ